MGWIFVCFCVGKVALDLCDSKRAIAILSDDDLHEVRWLTFVVFVGSVNKADFISIKFQLPRFPKVGHYRAMVAASFRRTG